jgi:hypothetical protein
MWFSADRTVQRFGALVRLLVGMRIKRRPLAGASFLLGLVGCSFVGASVSPQLVEPVEQKDFRRVPVVMIFLDELPLATLMDPQGNIDQGLFPNFARLQRSSVWFRNTTTVSEFTFEALPAMLTGKYPRDLDPVTESRSLFTLLGDAYKVRTNEDLDALCHPKICRDALRHSPRTFRKQFRAFAAGQRGRDFASFLQLFERSRKPRFYFLRLVMPHQPWRYLPSGQRYQTSDVPGQIDIAGRGKAWIDNAWLVTQAYQRHLLQTQLVDRALGVVMRYMKRLDLFDRALFVVTADQGISFLPGLPKRQLRAETAGQVAAVPFFVKLPDRQDGRISDVPLETVDLLPTVADVLDLSMTWRGLDGVSGFSPDIPPDRRRGFRGLRFDPSPQEAFAAARMKYELFSQAPRRQHLDPFRIGPGRSERLIGMKVGAAGNSGTFGLPAVVRNLDAYPRADADGEFFPAVVDGYIPDAALGEPFTIAIGVDGHIATVTRTFTEEGRVKFTALLPPRFFTRASHRIELFVVDRTDPARLLRLPVLPG